MENIDLGALGEHINSEAIRITAARKKALLEAKTQDFKNPRFARPTDPRLPFVIKGSDEKSLGYKLELLIEPRFADLVRKKIALSDDFYLDLLLMAMQMKTKEDLDAIERQLGEYHGYLWSTEVWANFKKDAAFYAGYFDISVRINVETVIGEVHPVLGDWTSVNDINIVEVADKWNRQFLAHEKALHDEDTLRKIKIQETTDKLLKERQEIIDKGLNSHSNKVRRRTKKKYGDNIR
jgi:hypothetical protein